MGIMFLMYSFSRLGLSVQKMDLLHRTGPLRREKPIRWSSEGDEGRTA